MSISTISNEIAGRIQVKEGKRLISYHTGAITYEPRIVCGSCGNFASLHIDEEREINTFICYRDRYEVGDLYAPRVTGHEGTKDEFDSLDGLPLEDLSGPGTMLRDDRWPIEPEVSDGYDEPYRDIDSEYRQIGTTKDGEPIYSKYATVKADTLTPTLEQWQAAERERLTSPTPHANRSVPSFANRAQRIYVEGDDHFLEVTVLNMDLTVKHHAKVLNAFKDKYGIQRVGSIEVFTNTDQTITARCVQSGCYTTAPDGTQHRSTMTIHPDATEQQREDFVFSIIRHGNNHAAAWFINRPEFYKVHEVGCTFHAGQGDCSGVNCDHVDPNYEHSSVRRLAEFINSKRIA